MNIFDIYLDKIKKVLDALSKKNEIVKSIVESLEELN